MDLQATKDNCSINLKMRNSNVGHISCSIDASFNYEAVILVLGNCEEYNTYEARTRHNVVSINSKF